jgi:hypothetical protein
MISKICNDIGIRLSKISLTTIREKSRNKFSYYGIWLPEGSLSSFRFNLYKVRDINIANQGRLDAFSNGESDTPSINLLLYIPIHIITLIGRGNIESMTTLQSGVSRTIIQHDNPHFSPPFRM